MNVRNTSKSINYHTTSLCTLDLDVENYDLDDLFHLFNIDSNEMLDESKMRQAKHIVLKMHPDKSKLDSKYFLFFSAAYKRLFSIYEFQNKREKKVQSIEYDSSNSNESQNNAVLHQMFEKNKHLRESGNFNQWFNDAFKQNRIDDPLQDGHGDWLKSNEGFITISENVNKGNMNDILEKHKRQTQQHMVVYQGISDSMANTFAGSLLDGSDCGGNYIDIKEAYTQTLIPVTQEDFLRMPKFNNVNEYKTHRDKVDVTPISNEDGLKILARQKMAAEKQSASLAMKFAKQESHVQQKQQSFWSSLKQLTGL